MNEEIKIRDNRLEQGNTGKEKTSGNRQSATCIPVDDTPKTAEDSSTQKDIESRGYYYDDATGYEIFNPDEDDDEN